jgi:hypothetical protein
MVKSLKMFKMAPRDNPHPTVSGSEGSIHIYVASVAAANPNQGLNLWENSIQEQW